MLSPNYPHHQSTRNSFRSGGRYGVVVGNDLHVFGFTDHAREFSIANGGARVLPMGTKPDRSYTVMAEGWKKGQYTVEHLRTHSLRSAVLKADEVDGIVKYHGERVYPGGVKKNPPAYPLISGSC